MNYILAPIDDEKLARYVRAFSGFVWGSFLGYIVGIATGNAVYLINKTLVSQHGNGTMFMFIGVSVFSGVAASRLRDKWISRFGFLCGASITHPMGTMLTSAIIAESLKLWSGIGFLVFAGKVAVFVAFFVLFLVLVVIYGHPRERG